MPDGPCQALPSEWLAANLHGGSSHAGKAPQGSALRAVLCLLSVPAQHRIRTPSQCLANELAAPVLGAYCHMDRGCTLARC